MGHPQRTEPSKGEDSERNYPSLAKEARMGHPQGGARGMLRKSYTSLPVTIPYTLCFHLVVTLRILLTGGGILATLEHR